MKFKITTIILQASLCFSAWAQTPPNLEEEINKISSALPAQQKNDPSVIQALKEYEISQFRAIDLNRDNRISFEEFKKFTNVEYNETPQSILEAEKKLIMRASINPTPQDWFHFYDKPQKGFWTFENWVAYQNLENASLMWSQKNNPPAEIKKEKEKIQNQEKANKIQKNPTNLFTG